MATGPTVRSDAEYIDLIRRELRLVRILGERVFVNWWLVASNLALFALAWMYGFRLTDGFGFSADRYMPLQMVFYTGMKVNAEINGGAWWRLPASMWVHLDFLHVGFNIYGLWVVGRFLEKFYGARRYFTIYMATGLVGAAASYWFNDMDSGGASGALYGLVGALLVFGIRNRRALPERVVKGFTTGLLPWVALSIGIGFFDQIPFDNAAHLGGLFSGMLLALVLGSKLQPMGRAANAVLWVTTVAGLVIVLLTAWFWSAEAMQCLATGDAYLQCYPDLAPVLVK